MAFPLLPTKQLRVLLLCLLLAPDLAASAETFDISKKYPPYRDAAISTGFRECSYTDEGNGTGIFRVTVDTPGFGGFGTGIVSRAILLHTYDQNGTPSLPGDFADQVSMNGTPSSGPRIISGFFVYSGRETGGDWINMYTIAERVEIRVQKRHFQAWPAIGVRIGFIANYGSPLVRDTRIAFISTTDNSSNCITGDPTKPPPQYTKISMTAPDWNLGELSPGEQTRKSFSGVSEQLCFSYDGPQMAGFRYAISATNQNSLSGNDSYQLRHLASPSDTVPYRVLLQNTRTNTTVELPNIRNTVSTLDNGGRECFSPTFTVDTPKAAKEGDYGDVLSFTVVTQP